MKVMQCLNNNVVVVSINGQKVIVTGKGIGFNVKRNDIIPKGSVEQMFILQEDMTIENFMEMVNKIPLDIIQLAYDIIQNGKVKIAKKLSENLIVTFADHIQFALERFNQGMIITHPLSWEIQQIYPIEYQFARDTVMMMRERLKRDIPDQEVPFIAMHFINAEQEMENLGQTAEFTKLMYEFVKIIQYHFQVTLDQTTLDFSRFVTHLRYFLIRQMKATKTDNNMQYLVPVVNERFPEELQCVEKITQFLAQKYGWILNDSEQIYLILHVNRIIEKIK